MEVSAIATNVDMLSRTFRRDPSTSARDDIERGRVTRTMNLAMP